MKRYDTVIIGTGPAGLATAFTLLEARPASHVLLIDRSRISSGGLTNDCKMNFTYPIGFPADYWDAAVAGRCLQEVERKLGPTILARENLAIYSNRAQKLGVSLLEVRQSHLGTDGGVRLARQLAQELARHGAELGLGETAVDVLPDDRVLVTDTREIGYHSIKKG